ncbi:MAG: hypothetical protein R2744_02330 [Bacteroidales bacterium]
MNKIGKEYSDDGLNTSDLTLNRSEYFHQKIISRIEKDEIEHVRLISVYFPKLVNEYEKVFAVK